MEATWLCVILDQKQEAFIYCGHHSTFSLYPKFNNINIDISVAESIFIILNALYSVMDKDLIINNPTVQHSESVKLLSNHLIRSEQFTVNLFDSSFQN